MQCGISIKRCVLIFLISLQQYLLLCNMCVGIMLTLCAQIQNYSTPSHSLSLNILLKLLAHKCRMKLVENIPEISKYF